MKLNKSNLLINTKTTLSRWGFSKQGLFNNSKGEWYLFSQILIVLLHLTPPYPKIENMTFFLDTLLIIIGLTISVKGIIIVVRAFIDLGENITPLPYPLSKSFLIKDNSYKNTRHPIYKGLLFISLGVCILSQSIIHLLLLLSLAFVLKVKALKEEEWLKIRFPEYTQYIKEVPAIIKQINYLDWRS